MAEARLRPDRTVNQRALPVEKRYQEYPTLLSQRAEIIPPQKPIIIDTVVHSEGKRLGLGDNVIETGFIKLLQKYSSSVTLLTQFPFLYRERKGTIISDDSNLEVEKEEANIQSILSQATEDTYLILPPDHPSTRERLAIWENAFQQRINEGKSCPRVIFDLTNILWWFESIDYPRTEFPQLNRVALALASRLRKATEIPFDPDELMPSIEITQQQSEKADIYLRSQGVTDDDVVIAIGDRAMVAWKEWDKYPELLQKILAKFPNAYFIFIDPDTAFDSGAIDSLPESVRERVLYSAKISSFDFQPGLIKRANFFIGNDTGTGHYFSAINSGKKPTISLFSKEFDPDRWFPCGYYADYLFSDTDGNVLSREQYDQAVWQKAMDHLGDTGIVNISVEDVMERIDAIYSPIREVA